MHSLRIAAAAILSSIMLCSEVLADTPQEQLNKRTVLEFYELAFNARNFDAASKHLGEKYVPHDPAMADGKEGLKRFIAELQEKFPQSRREVKRAMTDGDYVILQVHWMRTPGATGDVVGDIFRLEGGRIVEHWAVVHPITEKPHPKNQNAVF